MGSSYSIELEKENQRKWVELRPGIWSPLGNASAEDLLARGEQTDGKILVRNPCNGEPREVSIENARWMRVGQKTLESDDGFLLQEALKLEMIGTTSSRSATIASGEGLARECHQRGLDIDAAEALLEGKPVFTQYERTPFGVFPNTTISK